MMETWVPSQLQRMDRMRPALPEEDALPALPALLPPPAPSASPASPAADDCEDNNALLPSSRPRPSASVRGLKWADHSCVGSLLLTFRTLMTPFVVATARKSPLRSIAHGSPSLLVKGIACRTEPWKLQTLTRPPSATNTVSWTSVRDEGERRMDGWMDEKEKQRKEKKRKEKK